MNWLGKLVQREIGRNDTVLNIGNMINGLGNFLDNSYDIVLLLGVLENFYLHEAEYLLIEAERIARKKVIVYTTLHLYQEHKCLVDYRNLEASGYFVTFPEPDGNIYGVKTLCNHK